MKNRTYVACVGSGAYVSRIEGDLHIDHRDRRLIICRSHLEMDRLRGLRGLNGTQLVWVDMDASPRQREVCTHQKLIEVGVPEARELLHG